MDSMCCLRVVYHSLSIKDLLALSVLYVYVHLYKLRRLREANRLILKLAHVCAAMLSTLVNYLERIRLSNTDIGRLVSSTVEKYLQFDKNLSNNILFIEENCCRVTFVASCHLKEKGKQFCLI